VAESDGVAHFDRLVCFGNNISLRSQFFCRFIPHQCVELCCCSFHTYAVVVCACGVLHSVGFWCRQHELAYSIRTTCNLRLISCTIAMSEGPSLRSGYGSEPWPGVSQDLPRCYVVEDDEHASFSIHPDNLRRMGATLQSRDNWRQRALHAASAGAATAVCSGLLLVCLKRVKTASRRRNKVRQGVRTSPQLQPKDLTWAALPQKPHARKTHSKYRRGGSPRALVLTRLQHLTDPWPYPQPQNPAAREPRTTSSSHRDPR
jgi:hypothetical protein